MGQKGKLLKIPAIAGLAVSMLLHRFFMYLRGGSKRFICTAFILLCFMVGNSFAYPVFGNNGFVSTEGSQHLRYYVSAGGGRYGGAGRAARG